MTSRSPGTRSTISYVYARRRPRNWATKDSQAPTPSGGAVFHSTALMLTYHSGALDGSAAYAATLPRGRSITISVRTSTGTIPPNVFVFRGVAAETASGAPRA